MIEIMQASKKTLSSLDTSCIVDDLYNHFISFYIGHSEYSESFKSLV